MVAYSNKPYLFPIDKRLISMACNAYRSYITYLEESRKVEEKKRRDDEEQQKLKFEPRELEPKKNQIKAKQKTVC